MKIEQNSPYKRQSFWKGEQIETGVELFYSWVYQPASCKATFSVKSELKHVRERYRQTTIEIRLVLASLLNDTLKNIQTFHLSK